MKKTLLLSQSYEAISTISWKRAFCLVLLEKADLLEEYDSEIHSALMTFKVPAVIRLIKAFKKNKHILRFSKQNVFARDKWQCQYCGKEKSISELTYDHVVPKSKGGKTCWENIVTACKECNSKKADKTVQQAGMIPKKYPIRPDWVPMLIIQKKQIIPEIWKEYFWSNK